MEANVPLLLLIEDEQANHSRLWRSTLTNSKTVTESAVEFGKDAKEAVEELGRSAGRKLEDARDQTAGALHTAAASVRKTGRQ